ncbi:hypothetical protein BDZ91DRAFT_762869 [Kalaharituber pfeilii]|nr:hypothetical protein BDZ91DRAFT_762869 [Kalaharituber pfeilii]
MSKHPGTSVSPSLSRNKRSRPSPCDQEAYEHAQQDEERHWDVASLSVAGCQSQDNTNSGFSIRELENHLFKVLTSNGFGLSEVNTNNHDGTMATEGGIQDDSNTPEVEQQERSIDPVGAYLGVLGDGETTRSHTSALETIAFPPQSSRRIIKVVAPNAHGGQYFAPQGIFEMLEADYFGVGLEDYRIAVRAVRKKRARRGLEIDFEENSEEEV